MAYIYVLLAFSSCMNISTGMINEAGKELLTFLSSNETTHTCMYIYTHACTYIHMLCYHMHTHTTQVHTTHTYTHGTYTSMCARVCLHVWVRERVGVGACGWVCMYGRVWVAKYKHQTHLIHNVQEFPLCICHLALVILHFMGTSVHFTTTA